WGPGRNGSSRRGVDFWGGRNYIVEWRREWRGERGGEVRKSDAQRGGGEQGSGTGWMRAGAEAR
ncbi:hypothetical protein KI387_042127, partial [Taxus chinensis]